MRTFISSLFSKKDAVEQTQKATLNNKPQITNPIQPATSTYRSIEIDYTKAEVDGILEWEQRNKGRDEELRAILKQKPNSDIKNHLESTRDVIYLGEKLKTNPELVKEIAKNNEGNAKEIIAILKIETKNQKYFKEIFKCCPNIKASDYEKILQVYSDLYPRLKFVLSEYSELLKIKKEIEILQKNNGDKKELFEKFEKYKWLSPAHVKERISKNMLETMSINDMPTMTIEDLIQKLDDVKNSKGRIDYLNNKFNTERKTNFDPYTLSYH